MNTNTIYHLFVKPKHGDHVNLYFDAPPSAEDVLDALGERHEHVKQIIETFGVLDSQKLHFAGEEVGYMNLTQLTLNCRRLQ